MVRGEHDIGAVGEGVYGLGEIARPSVRVTYQRAAQGQQVMQVVGGVLGHAQRAESREIEVHLGRRLGTGGHLELDLDAVDGVLLPGFADVDRRHDQRHFAGGPDLSESASHLPLRAAGEHGSVHVGSASRHRRAGVDVLLHGVFGEVLGRDDRDLAGIDVRLRRHPEHASEVVDVAVGVDDRDHLAVAAMRAIQRQGGGRGLGGDQRIDHDDPGVTLDEADVGQIEAADLVDALDHLVEALLGAQLALPPQARVHRRRHLARPGMRRHRCPTRLFRRRP